MAVVLAGGRGTRLRPYTMTIPKPLVPLGDKPIVELIIRRLARCGFGRIWLAVNHMGDLIQAYFGDGRRFGVEILYSLEEEQLGTIAPLRLITDLAPHFLVMNADVLTDLDLAALLDRHAASGALFTVAATRRTYQLDYGVLDVDDGRLAGFREKPRLEETVSMGVYAVSLEALAFIPPTGPFGFDQLMLKLIAEGQRVDVVRHDGFWLDIGRPDDYERANQEMHADPARFE